MTMTGPSTWAATDIEPVAASDKAAPSAALFAMSSANTSATLSMASAVNALVDEIIDSAETEALSELYDMYDEALSGKEIEDGQVVEDKSNASSGESEKAPLQGETVSGVNADASIEQTISQVLAAPEVQSVAASVNLVSDAAQTNTDTAVTESVSEAADPTASV